MWCEQCDPHWQWDDKIVAFLFVHGLHDRLELFCYQRVVAMFPVGHEILLQASCVEHVWTSSGHDFAIVAK